MGLTIETLNLGSVQVDSNIFMRNRPANSKLRLPVWAYLIQGSPAGPILVDTGFRDTALAEAMGMQAEVPPGAGLEPELARCGLRPEDVRYIVHTHLHLDHAGNDAHFPMKTTVVLNRRELELAAAYGTLAYPPQETKHIIDRVYTRGAAWLLDLPEAGRIEIAPGIECELAGGHTEGSMNVLVEIEGGIACICGDLIYSVQEQLVKPTAQEGHLEFLTTGNYDVTLVQERRAVGKAIASGRWILPMHDVPAEVDRGGLVLGRLEGTSLPGPVVAVNEAERMQDDAHREPWMEDEALADLAGRWLN